MNKFSKGMINNTKIIVKIGFKEIIQAAYNQLLKEGSIPYASGDSNFHSKYKAGWDDPEKRTGLFVEFYVKETKKVPKKPEKPYEVGDWLELEEV